ncbi:hypothetical protein D3C72_203110 [compost metagenome]
MPADAGFGAIIVQVGKIRSLVAGGTVFMPGALLEAFAGVAEIPSGHLSTNYPFQFNANNVPSTLTLGPEGEISFIAYMNLSPKFFTVSAQGIVDVEKCWFTTAPYGEGTALSVTGIQDRSIRAWDPQGNLFLAGREGIYMVPTTNGTYYGKAMLAGSVYIVAGDRRTSGSNTGAIDDVPATDIRVAPGQASSADRFAVDAQGNLFFGDNLDMARLRMVPRASGTYYGQVMIANHIYTLHSGALDNSTVVRHVGIDSTGNVYFIRGNSGLYKVAPDGSVTNTGVGATNLAVGSDDTVYTSSSRTIRKIVGGAATTIMAAAQGDGDDGLPLAQAQVFNTDGLTISSEGHLYFVDTVYSCIRMIPKTSGTYHGKAMLANHVYIVAGSRSVTAPEGTPKEQLILYASSLSGTVPLNLLKVDALGNVYFPQTPKSIAMIPAVSGTYFGKPMSAGQVHYLDLGFYGSQVALLPSGELYLYGFINAPGGRQYFVKKVALDGSVSDILVEPSAFNFSTDPKGNLYLLSANKIEMIPVISGTYFGQVMTAGNRYTVAGNGTGGTATGIATGATLQGNPSITFDASGNLYTTLTGNLVRMVPNVAGTYFGQAMSVGNIYPLAISGIYPTCDSLGNLYTWYNSKIVKLSTNGQLSNFAGGGVGEAGSLAKNANLSYIKTMTFGPDGAFYLIQDRYTCPQIMRIR